MSDESNDAKRHRSSLTRYPSFSNLPQDLLPQGFNLERPEINFAKSRAARAANIKAQEQQRAVAARPIMDTQTFTQYMEQERKLRNLDKNDWIRQMEQDRRDNVKYYQERIRQEEEMLQKQDAELERRVAIDIAETVPLCGGETEEGVRNWLREIEMTLPYTELTNMVACRRATGSLKRDIENFLGTKQQRAHKTWNDLKAHIKEAFLSPDEEETRSNVIESIKQKDFETTAEYGRRFKEAAQEAYPCFGEPGRTESERKLLWKHYLRGLRDSKVAEKIIGQNGEKTLTAAMQEVARLDAKQFRIERARQSGWISSGNRDVEPMDVNNMETKPAHDKPASENKDIRELQRQMTGVTANLTKVTAALEKLSLESEEAAYHRQAEREYYESRDFDGNWRTRDNPRNFNGNWRSRNNGRRQEMQNDYYEDSYWPERREPPPNATKRTGFLWLDSDDSPRRRNKQQGPNRMQRDAPICDACGKIGHTTRNCRTRQMARLTASVKKQPNLQGGE